MSAVIVIKAWDTFQHYKDRDPPWVKLYRDLLTAESWVLGTDDSRLVQVASMLLAARYRNATPLNFTLFARVASLDLPESRFRAAIDHLVSTGFLEIQGDAQPVKVSASKALATCTSETEAETDKEAEGDKKLRPLKAANTPELERVKQVYPRRVGGNPWGKAQKAISARLAEGATWPEMTAGVERYAAFCAATGKVGTEYVKQAATFFGPDRHYLDPWTPPATKSQVKQDANVAASVAWLETRL
jgi:hypothetical protein